MAKHDAIEDAEIRTLAARAHEVLREGDPSESVKLLARAFLLLLERKPAILDEVVGLRGGREMPAVLRWPQLGADLKPDSVALRKPEIEFSRDRFSVSEALTYYEYLVDTALGHQA